MAPGHSPRYQPRHRVPPPAFPTAGFQQIYLEPLLKFHISLKKLQLHEAEYVLLQAMLLFSPGERRGRGGARGEPRPSGATPDTPSCPPRPRQHHPARLHRPVPGEGGADPQELHRPPAPHARGQVQPQHNASHIPHISHISHIPRPLPRFLYAKLLLLLTELQTLKVENTRQILHIQDLSSMTPLLSEIIS